MTRSPPPLLSSSSIHRDSLPPTADRAVFLIVEDSEVITRARVRRVRNSGKGTRDAQYVVRSF